MSWVPLREPGSGKLLARYDPERDIIEFQRRGIKTVIDLQQVKESANERRIAAQSKDCVSRMET